MVKLRNFLKIEFDNKLLIIWFYYFEIFIELTLIFILLYRTE